MNTSILMSKNISGKRKKLNFRKSASCLQMPGSTVLTNALIVFKKL